MPSVVTHTAHWDNTKGNSLPSYLILDTRLPWGSESFSIDPPVFFLIFITDLAGEILDGYSGCEMVKGKEYL
jgi:hypothetical protein